MFINSELNTQYNKILVLIERSKELEPDDELRSHLAKYICVLCSGFIENSVYHTFSDIAERYCEPSVVLTYTKGQLYKIQNANSEKIRQLAKSFNPDWHDNLRDYLQEDNRGGSINYILKERHNIAHGRNSDITIVSLENHLNKVIEVIQYIETELIEEETNV